MEDSDQEPDCQDSESDKRYVMPGVPAVLVYCQNSQGFNLGALFNIFEAYLIHGAIFHKDLVNSLIYDLLDNRRIETDLPSTSRVTLAEGKDFDMLHVKVTYPEIRNTRGIIEEHTCVPAVAVVGEYKKVRTLPDMKKVKSKRVNGRTFITLPEICAYQPFLLEK